MTHTLVLALLSSQIPYGGASESLTLSQKAVLEPRLSIGPEVENRPNFYTVSGLHPRGRDKGEGHHAVGAQAWKKKTLSVFGAPDDGEMGTHFAGGGAYKRDTIAFACNAFPLNSMITVTMPDGTSLTGRNADKCGTKCCDCTLRAWNYLTHNKPYGHAKGRVRRAK